MSNTDLDQLRGEFEASGITGRLYRNNTPGSTEYYEDSHTQIAWRAWQEARRASPQPVAHDRQNMSHADMLKLCADNPALASGLPLQHPSAAPSAPLDDNECARLRRVVRALGMEKEVPDDDATLRGCLFSVLGMIALKLERGAAPSAQCQWPTCQPEQAQQEVAAQIYRELYSGEQAPSAQIADDHAGDELRDLWIHDDMDLDSAKAIASMPRKDLKTAYLNTVENLIVWRRRALTAEATQHPSVPVQEQRDKVDERALFEAWWHERSLKSWQSGLLASEYGKPMPDGWGDGYKRPALEAWQARAQQSCPPVQAGAPVYQWRQKPVGSYQPAWYDATKEEAYERVDECYEARTLYATRIPAHPTQDGEDARDAERYRWLRHADLDAMAAEYWPGTEVPEGEEFDKAIDAAMAATQQGGSK